jgi:hypothetical protein
MSITEADARAALRLVDEAGQRSATLRRYQSAAPHVILWGGVYAVAYTLSALRPDRSWLVWLILVPCALMVDALISRQCRGRFNWRLSLGLFALLFVFVNATALIMHPSDARQMAAFLGLVAASAYVVLGIILGRRLVFTGIALGAVTLVGFFAVPAIFMPWMAAAGGGALVIGGLWLRRI